MDRIIEYCSCIDCSIYDLRPDRIKDIFASSVHDQITANKIKNAQFRFDEKHASASISFQFQINQRVV